jgi:signal transduction histidine kinase
MAAHQIRTPLTLVLGEADLDHIAAQPGEESARQALQRVGVAAHQMRRRVDELFLLAEAEAGTAIPLDEDVELDGLILECTDMARGRASTAGLRLALGTIEPATVRGNTSLLREALIELLENACRYGTAEAPVTTELRHEGSWAVLSVSNAASPHAEVSSGSQLGLRIVRWIAEGHRGVLLTSDVGSDPDEATYTVRLRLPSI